MTADDAPEFLKALTLLAEVFDASLSPERAHAYFRALEDLPLAQVTVGIDVATRSATFFPKPAELRDWARGRDPRRMEAARKRGWDPEAPGFLPNYQGDGPAIDPGLRTRLSDRRTGGGLTRVGGLLKLPTPDKPDKPEDE